MLEFRAARQAYQAQEVLKIGFVLFEYNIADGLTKAEKQAASISILSKSRHTTNCERWVFRDKSPKTDGTEKICEIE